MCWKVMMELLNNKKTNEHFYQVSITQGFSKQNKPKQQGHNLTANKHRSGANYNEQLVTYRVGKTE